MTFISFWNELLLRIEDVFSAKRLIDWLSIAALNLTLVLAVIGLFYLAWLLVSRLLFPRLRLRTDRTTAAMLETMIKLLVLVTGAIVALSAVGIEAEAVLTSLGLLSLALGFALRDTFSNMISGFLIFVDRPFTIDDLVEIDGHYGRVDQISLRATRIVTADGRMLALPNSLVMTKIVASYTNSPHFRLDIAIAVGLNQDLDQVRAILLALVEGDAIYMKDPMPRVIVVKLDDYKVSLELQVWIRDEHSHMVQSFKLREDAFKALKAAHVEMPLETIQLAPQHEPMPQQQTPEV